MVPPTFLFVGGELRERGARDEGEGGVALVEHLQAAEGVDEAGAAHAAFGPRGIEHEVIHDELGAAGEEIAQGGFALGAGEDVVFLQLDHREAAALGGDAVVEFGLGFFLSQQLDAGLAPRGWRGDGGMGAGAGGRGSGGAFGLGHTSDGLREKGVNVRSLVEWGGDFSTTMDKTKNRRGAHGIHGTKRKA